MPDGGMGAHHSPRMITDTWLTHQEVLAPLGVFDLDPCGAPGWATAEQHYIPPQDGLGLPWSGRVWLNPPGPSIVGPWLRRMAAHGDGIALIFARTETALLFETVWQAASAVLFLKGRLHVHRADGRRAANNSGAPSCLVAYGLANAMSLADCGLAGHFIQL